MIKHNEMEFVGLEEKTPIIEHSAYNIRCVIPSHECYDIMAGSTRFSLGKNGGNCIVDSQDELSIELINCSNLHVMRSSVEELSSGAVQEFMGFKVWDEKAVHKVMKKKSKKANAVFIVDASLSNGFDNLKVGIHKVKGKKRYASKIYYSGIKYGWMLQIMEIPDDVVHYTINPGKSPYEISL